MPCFATYFCCCCLFKAQDRDRDPFAPVEATELPLPATPASSTVRQRPTRKSRARAPKVDKVFIAEVAAKHVSREEGYVEFKDCLDKIHREYPGIHGNMKGAGFAYWVNKEKAARVSSVREGPAPGSSSAASSTPFSPVNATGKRQARESPAVHSPVVHSPMHNLTGAPSTPTDARRIRPEPMEDVIEFFAASLEGMDISPRKEPEKAVPTLAEKNRAARGGATTTLARQQAKEATELKVKALNIASVRWLKNRELKSSKKEYTSLATICEQAGKELGCTAPTEQAVSLRVGRHIKGNGSIETTGHMAPVLHEIEPLIVTMILEYAAYGYVFTGMEIRLKVATMISGTPLGDTYARCGGL
jgi:hypothetical protein